MAKSSFPSDKAQMFLSELEKTNQIGKKGQTNTKAKFQCICGRQQRISNEHFYN